eukprot:1409879-Amphidinium_carterae.2
MLVPGLLYGFEAFFTHTVSLKLEPVSPSYECHCVCTSEKPQSGIDRKQGPSFKWDSVNQSRTMKR